MLPRPSLETLGCKPLHQPACSCEISAVWWDGQLLSVPHERSLNRTCRREPFNKTLYLEAIATIISTGQNNLAVSINIPLDIGNLATVKQETELPVQEVLNSPDLRS